MLTALLALALPGLLMPHLPARPLSTLAQIPKPQETKFESKKESLDVRAKYLITVADDFIVDVYHNGRSVPLVKRELLQEIFGATVERINVEIKKGDWLVFNVVNNKLRWGGAYYFAVAGCFAPNEFGFVSDANQGNWAACDSPKDAENFIAWREALMHRPAQTVSTPWDQGDTLIRQTAGDEFKGTSIWGTSRNTWIKVLIE